MDKVTEEKIEKIRDAVVLGDKRESKLSPDVISVGGFTSDKIRHLLNNLGALATHVFEIGSHRGSTISAAIYGNENLKSVVVCDNFTEFNDDGDPKQDLVRNLDKFAPCINYLLEQDSFSIKSLPFAPDLYMYDGLHSDWAQEQALTHFYDMLPDEFIFTVDDYAWSDVQKGTMAGIEKCGFEVLFQAILGTDTPPGADSYWNGFAVFLLRKTK